MARVREGCAARPPQAFETPLPGAAPIGSIGVGWHPEGASAAQWAGDLETPGWQHGTARDWTSRFLREHPTRGPSAALTHLT